MKWSTGLWAALAVFLFGALAPGCIFGSEDDSVGRFCTSPVEGGAYCMRADRSPQSAWNEAEAHGSRPIEMWAGWPEEVPLDELVANREKLSAWFADVDEVVVHLRLNAQSAESYRASMAGRLGTLLQKANERQKELLAQKPVDAVGNFEGALVVFDSLPDLEGRSADLRS
jgi:hypothetical protein